MPPFSTINLFYKDDKSFPTGYLNTVLAKCQKNGVEVEVKDNRIYPRPNLPLRVDPNAQEMWENQTEALDEIKQHEVGTVSSATGTGKTRLIEETIALRGVKTLVIVPYRLIQNQLANKFIKSFGKKHVSTKVPKADPQAINQTQGEGPTYKKIGGNYKDLYDNATSDNTLSHGKKLGSSYQRDDIDTTKPKTKLGSSYSIEVNESKPKTKLGSSYGKEFFEKIKNLRKRLTLRKKVLKKTMDLRKTHF